MLSEIAPFSSPKTRSCDDHRIIAVLSTAVDMRYFTAIGSRTAKRRPTHASASTLPTAGPWNVYTPTRSPYFLFFLFILVILRRPLPVAHVTVIGLATYSDRTWNPPIPCVVLCFPSLTPVALVVSLQAALRCARQKESWSHNVYLSPWPE